MEPYFGLNFMNNNPTWETDTSGDGLPDAYQTMAGSGALGLPSYSKFPPRNLSAKNLFYKNYEELKTVFNWNDCVMDGS